MGSTSAFGAQVFFKCFIYLKTDGHGIFTVTSGEIGSISIERGSSL